MVWKPCHYALVEWPVAEWSICDIYVIHWGGSCRLGLGMFLFILANFIWTNSTHGYSFLFSFSFFVDNYNGNNLIKLVATSNFLWWYCSFVFSERSNSSERNPVRLSSGFLELFSSSQIIWKWYSNFLWDHRTFWWRHIQQGWHDISIQL